MKKYIVKFYRYLLYDVIRLDLKESESNPSLFRGSISDCLAWIRLKEEDRFTY